MSERGEQSGGDEPLGDARRGIVLRCLCAALLATSLAALVFYMVTNWWHGRDERNCRALWAIENSKMQNFLLTIASKDISVYQFCDDHECSVTVQVFVELTHRKPVKRWVTLPLHVLRNPTRPVMRKMAEMQKIIAGVTSGDILIIPVSRTNVRYVRMPSFEYASQVPQHLISPAVAKRLERVYTSSIHYTHRSIPPHVAETLEKKDRMDLLKSLRKTGLNYEFGWHVYRVK